jgi:hypothetical protein
MAREPIGAADLFVLLDREFRRRTPEACRTCFVSQPFRVNGTHRDAPDWDVVPLGECPNNCRLVLDDLVAQMKRKYRLAA